MPYEQRDNSGSLFRNDRRESEQHPNLKGSAMVGGEHYWVSAWTKTSKSGERWMSLSFTPKQEQAQAPAGKTETENWDDDIPF